MKKFWRVLYIIKAKHKTNSVVKSLGCSSEYLKNYLESLFQPDMNWNNWGQKNRDENGYYWEIDHIISFKNCDLRNKEQFEKICYFTNLRPCWYWANMARNFYSDNEIDFSSPVPKYFNKENIE